MWSVYMNGKYIGIKESNFQFASAYWVARRREGVVFSLRKD